MIDTFQGKYRFLSNFYPSIVSGPCTSCETVEHAFQAFKTVDESQQRQIAGAATPQLAKKLGRFASPRDDWDEIKVAVMYQLLVQKFPTPFDTLGSLLVETSPHQLVEGNTWGDRFWGVDVTGENWLGRLLMLRRSELFAQDIVTFCRGGY